MRVHTLRRIDIAPCEVWLVWNLMAMPRKIMDDIRLEHLRGRRGHRQGRQQWRQRAPRSVPWPPTMAEWDAGKGNQVTYKDDQCNCVRSGALNATGRQRGCDPACEAAQTQNNKGLRVWLRRMLRPCLARSVWGGAGNWGWREAIGKHNLVGLVISQITT